MDYSSFGLTAPPFSLAPSRSSMFMSAAHREALATLEWGIGDPDGFVMVVGEPGTGKTSVVAQLLQTERQGIRAVYMNQPATFPEILKLIAAELAIAAIPAAPGELAQLIKNILVRNQLRLVLIFDEAQALTDDTFEALRLFANESIAGKGGIKLVLIGHPKLRERLAVPGLEALDQRILTRTELLPLASSEVEQYIDYRLRMCGSSAGRLFSSAALRMIRRKGSRIPREINVLCQNALIHTYAVGAERIDAVAIAAALAGRGETGPRGAWRRTSAVFGGARVPVAVGAVAIATMLGAAVPWQLRDADGSRYWWQASEESVSSSGSRELDRKPDSPIVADAGQPLVRVEEPVAAAPSRERARQNSSAVQVAVTNVPSAAQTGAPSYSPAAPALRAPALPGPRSVNHSTTGEGVTADDASDAASDVSVGASDESVPAHQVTVRRGDTLTALALARLGSAEPEVVERIIRANPNLSSANLIYPGQTLQIPADGE